jgi:hypothetical protein
MMARHFATLAAFLEKAASRKGNKLNENPMARDDLLAFEDIGPVGLRGVGFATDKFRSGSVPPQPYVNRAAPGTGASDYRDNR